VGERVAHSLDVGLLGGCEDAFEETIAVSVEDFAEAAVFDEIDSL